MRSAAGGHLRHRAGGVAQIEHGVAPHFPIEIPRVWIVRVLDPDRPALGQRIVDLRLDFGVRQIGKKGKGALGDFHHISPRETLAFRPARDSDARSAACIPWPAFLDVFEGVLWGDLLVYCMDVQPSTYR